MAGLAVNKFTCENSFAVFQVMFLPGETVYMQAYEGKGGYEKIPVYTANRNYIGSLNTTEYWEVRKFLKQIPIDANK